MGERKIRTSHAQKPRCHGRSGGAKTRFQRMIAAGLRPVLSAPLRGARPDIIKTAPKGVGVSGAAKVSSELFDENAGAITRLLNSEVGAKGAIDQVFPIVYQELKVIAHRLLARGSNSTVTPTVLVHELYSKLNASEQLSVEGKKHFFSLCTRVMKQIIIDYVRAKAADKRMSVGPKVELADVDAMELSSPDSVLAIDVALRQLQARDERLAQIIEYRVFGGLELEEIAELYDVTLRQMQREWVRAKIWLTDSLV